MALVLPTLNSLFGLKMLHISYYYLLSYIVREIAIRTINDMMFYSLHVLFKENYIR